MPRRWAFWSFGGASRLPEHPRRAQAPRDRGVRGCHCRPVRSRCFSRRSGQQQPCGSNRAPLVGGSVQADDVKYLDRVVNTYSQLASSPEMANRVAAELHLAAPPDIEFAQVPNTNLVKLKITTGDRDSAAPAARRVTSLLISQVETLAAADVSAAERSFLNRTKRLELEKAQAQAELASLGAGTSASDTERALLCVRRSTALASGWKRFERITSATSPRGRRTRGPSRWLRSLHRPRVPRTGTSSSPSPWRSCLAASSRSGLPFWPRTCPAASGATMRSRPPSTRRSQRRAGRRRHVGARFVQWEFP